jgi:NCS1 family nucleobase:cation symporter-1
MHFCILLTGDVGLSATDAVLITLVAGICNAIPTVLNGAIGANLHVPFPIASRASHGYWFSYFAVVSRAVLAMFWFGVHTGYGGTCVSAVCLHMTLSCLKLL